MSSPKLPDWKTEHKDWRALHFATNDALMTPLSFYAYYCTRIRIKYTPVIMLNNQTWWGKIEIITKN